MAGLLYWMHILMIIYMSLAKKGDLLERITFMKSLHISSLQNQGNVCLWEMKCTHYDITITSLETLAIQFRKFFKVKLAD